MARASGSSKRQRPHPSLEAVAQDEAPARAPGWSAISELRWRRRTSQPVIFLSGWSRAAEEDARPSAHEAEDEAADEPDQTEEESDARPQARVRAIDLLPPVDVVRRVAERWTAILDEDEKQAAVVSYRAPGVVAPAELTSWLPGAAARLYTLGGLVAPLSDTALSRMPLAKYSVVRAPNMSFWPQLRALIERQEREEPGLELWEDLESDLDMLEQELAWWLSSPQGMILNLYEGETLVGHLSLARQYDEAEGCDGWGIIALHIAPQARGQRLGTILQRVAATLLVTRKALRRIEPPAEPEAEMPDMSKTAQMVALDTRQWPFIFGFVPAHNIPALRGAYATGRRIIGTYVDVPIAALQSSASAELSPDSAEE